MAPARPRCEPSKSVALIFKKYLTEAFDTIDPFVSDRDIGAGKNGMVVVHDELNNSAVGLLIVTVANQNAPWLNYEAGALGREVADSQSQVIPILVDSSHLSDIGGPISVYQAVTVEPDHLLKVFEALCDVAGLPRDRAAGKISTYYDGLRRDIDAALAAYREADAGEVSAAPVSELPSLADKIDEILTLSRDLWRERSRMGQELEERGMLVARRNAVDRARKQAAHDMLTHPRPPAESNVPVSTVEGFIMEMERLVPGAVVRLKSGEIRIHGVSRDDRDIVASMATEMGFPGSTIVFE